MPMKKYFYIMLGGIFGAILRYIIKGVHIYNYQENVPLNTLIINITGSFILALILTIAFEVWEFDADIRLGIATGFLGAYTTFSTFCKESALLMYKGLYFSAISYMTVSVVLGLSATYFGTVLARESINKIVMKKKELDNNFNETKDEVV
jgi:fluoride exporter